MIDALVVLTVLVLLWLLMARFGYDSRERVHSPEERLAARGFTWAELAAPPASQAPRRTQSTRAGPAAVTLQGAR